MTRTSRRRRSKLFGIEDSRSHSFRLGGGHIYIYIYVSYVLCCPKKRVQRLRERDFTSRNLCPRLFVHTEEYEVSTRPNERHAHFANGS